MSNKIRYGLKNTYISKKTETEDTLTGEITISYGTPFRLYGSVSLSLDAEGDEFVEYADNIKYYSDYTNNGYSGSLEMEYFSDAFKSQILNEVINDTNGVITEYSNKSPFHFALGYQYEGDEKARLTWLYDCVASRPSAEHATTEDSKEAAHETLEFTASPRRTDYKVKAVTQESTPDTIYNGWFDAVFDPAVLNSLKVTDTTDTTATVTFKSNKAGTYYYISQLASADDPTVSSVISETSGTATDGTNTISLTSLTAETDYTVYIVVVDSDGNASDMSSIDITTDAA